MKKPEVVAFLAGALFAAGLAVSGMTRPDKIVGFLDVSGGAWDPSLAFVMIGAVGVHFLAHRIARRRSAPLLGDVFHMPTRKDVDGRLVGGAALFGVGWGLGGFCPGPAIVAAGGGSITGFVFLAGMTIGIVIEDVVRRRPASAAPTS